MTQDKTKRSLDLNCDMGESYGSWSVGNDAALLDHVTSANIACGFHAGDPGVMRQTVALAIENGVALGAHPGFPDLAGFGRRPMRLSPREVEDLVVYQIGALTAVAAAQGATLQHVKPHGALYNMAAADSLLADAIARAVAGVDRRLVLVGLAGSEIIHAGRRAGLSTASEVFADRGYASDGSLLPRGTDGALIEDPDRAAARAVDMVCGHTVTTSDGHRIDLEPDTICIHGDTPQAPDVARAIRGALEHHGVVVKAIAAV